MKVSIITPSYNSLNFLKDCYESVQNQNYHNIEHIVIDGLSSDGTQEWAKDKNIKFKSEKDNGMWDAVNKGIDLSTGDIIIQLNCDEQLMENVIEKCVEVFKKNESMDFFVGDVIFINEDSTFNCYRKALTIKKDLIISLSLYASTCATFYRKKIFDSQKFDTDFKDSADADFVYKLLEEGYKYKLLKFYTSIFMIRSDNKQISKNAYEECMFLRKKYNHPKTLFKKIKKYFYSFINLIWVTKVPLKYTYFWEGKKNYEKIYFPSFKIKKIL